MTDNRAHGESLPEGGDFGNPMSDEGTEFLGEYRHSLDTKGRMILPADFREQLGGEAYVTAFPDGCLAICTPQEFRRRVADVRQRVTESDGDRAEARLLGALSVKAAPDNQGRMAIPPKLRSYASLEKEVVVVGVFNHIELWNPAKWDEQEAAGSAGLLKGSGSVARAGF